MNKNSCDVILDLMPLVKDNVASQASKDLVKDHLKTCKNCKEIYKDFDREEFVMDDRKLINKMKKQILIAWVVVIVIASMLGLALSDTMGMFYNIIIMPAIGIVGYLALDKKSYYVPISLIIFSYIWLFIKYIGEGIIGEGLIAELFLIPMYWSLIYAGLSIIGLLIGFLLKYAFGKEKSYEN